MILICALRAESVLRYSASDIFIALAIFLAFLTASLLLVFTEGSHLAKRETCAFSLSASRDALSALSVLSKYVSTSFSTGVPSSAKRSSYLPYSLHPGPSVRSLSCRDVAGGAKIAFVTVYYKKRISSTGFCNIFQIYL